MKKITLLTTLLLCATMMWAQFSDADLFAAYLRNDMTTWKAYIDGSNWDKLSQKEKCRLIGYEYGFVAFQLDEDKKVKDESKHLGPKYLEAFRQHVTEMKPYLKESTYDCYWSSVNAYDYLLDAGKLKSGLAAYKLAKASVEAGPNDPLAHALCGSVLFFAPRIFGGSKPEAHKHFLKAEQLFRAMSKEQRAPQEWNYASIEMYLAQSIEKTESVDAAIKKCQEILKEMPDYTYIRDEYLPALLKKAKSK